MKKIVLILSSFLILGCSTKKKVVTKQREETKETVISKTENTQKENLKESTIKESLQVQKEDKLEEKKDIQIVGKVDKENPVTYYNVVNGDTIDLFKITGNADFIFKSTVNSQKSNVNNNSSTNTQNNKESEKSISNAVENVKTAVKEVQTKSVDIVKKDFTFGSYLTFFLWGLVIIIILALILWLRKSTFWTEIINKIKNKI